jgi:hypothetical protein
MTPNAIEILLHCHVSPLPHPRKDAPAVWEEICRLRANNLIEPAPGSDGGYRTTDRGRAHVEQLCRTAWPVPAWMGADGKIIDMT